MGPRTALDVLEGEKNIFPTGYEARTVLRMWDRSSEDRRYMNFAFLHFATKTNLRLYEITVHMCLRL